jgi:hypothetical protein
MEHRGIEYLIKIGINKHEWAWSVRTSPSKQGKVSGSRDDAVYAAFVVGIAALVACALCYWAAAAFMGSLLARRMKGYRPFDLFMIGVLGLPLIAAGSALMIWSGFSLRLYDVEISGLTWALLGAASAVVVVRIDDAVRGTFRG